MGYGMKGHLGISFQTSYSDPVTASMTYIPFISESLDESIEDLTAEGLRVRFDEGEAYEGMHDISGDISLEAHPITLGLFLKALTNNASGTLAGSVWTHEFIPQNTDFSTQAAVVPLTIEVHRDTGSSFLYSDCLVSQLALEYANGAINKVTASIVGGNFVKTVKSTPSFDAGSYFTWNQSSVSIAGAGTDCILDATLTVNNNLEGVHCLGTSKFPSRVLRSGPRTVEFGGTALFESQTEVDVFRARTEQLFKLTSTGASITTSQNNEIVVDIPKLLYTEYPVQMGGPGRIEVGFNAKGKYSTDSSYAVRFTLTNTKAAY
jgi:hypothetical protein